MNDLISRCELFNKLAGVHDMGNAYAVIQAMETKEDPEEAYYRGKIDGIEECTGRLKKLRDEFGV